MKKIIIPIITVIVIALMLVGYFILRDKDAKKPTNTEESTTSGYPENLAMGNIYFGTIDSFYNTIGTVTRNSEDFIVLYEADITKADSLLVKEGEEIEKGATLYKEGGKDITAASSGKIVKIEYNEDKAYISFLDYSKLYIECSVTEKVYKSLDYMDEVNIQSEGYTYECEILYIDYLLLDGRITVQIKPKEDVFFLPGAETDVYIKTETSPEMLYIFSDFLYWIGDVSYCNAFDEKTFSLEPVQLQIGDKYTSLDNGVVFEYYEVISGGYKDMVVATIQE